MTKRQYSPAILLLSVRTIDAGQQKHGQERIATSPIGECLRTEKRILKLFSLQLADSMRYVFHYTIARFMFGYPRAVTTASLQGSSFLRYRIRKFTKLLTEFFTAAPYHYRGPGSTRLTLTQILCIITSGYSLPLIVQNILLVRPTSQFGSMKLSKFSLDLWM